MQAQRRRHVAVAFAVAFVATGAAAALAASEATRAESAVGLAVADAPEWRSVLYPENWAPAWTAPDGAFLHDVSYAGYRHGEAVPGEGRPGVRLDVVADFGADPTGATDATAHVQRAIDAAAALGGAVVSFPPGLYRVDGTLSVRTSGTVLAGAGPKESRLWFTRHAVMSFGSHLTIEGTLRHGPDAVLAEDGASRSRVVRVADATGLRAGDDVAVGWVISDAFVAEHGMTGTWRVFHGTWQPFFRRTIVEVDATVTPPRVVLDVPLRYPAKVRDAASLRVETGHLREVGVEGLGVANAVARADAWRVTQVHAIALRGVVDAWVRDVASFPSPGSTDLVRGERAHLQSGGILVEASNRVTVADSRMSNAQHRGSGGNGYLFEVKQSSEVLFRDLDARNGRHNFIQNWGFGTSGWVLLRVRSSGGEALPDERAPIGTPGFSEFHHSLAMANLADASTFHDGFQAVNRGNESSGAGHSATETVIWNARGVGAVRSQQYGRGYVIGTSPNLAWTATIGPGSEGTAPQDHAEGIGLGAALRPQSLYEDMLARRLGR